MVTVVGVFGHLALRFLVERHVVREGLGAADLDAAEGSFGVERPALFVLAVVAECAAPGVLHDPETLAVLVVAPADALDRMASFRSTLIAVATTEAASIEQQSAQRYTYEDIREQELKCKADRNREWKYDAATNTWACPLQRYD